MRGPIPKTPANLLVAGGLFVASFLITRTLLIDRSSEPDGDTPAEITPPHPGASSGSGSLLPSSPGNREISRAGAIQSSRKFFERWLAAKAKENDGAVRLIIEEWAREFPKAGVELALQENQSGLAWKLAERWAVLDDESAISMAKIIPVGSTPDIRARHRLLCIAIGKRFRERPEDLEALLADFPLDLKSYEYQVGERDIGDLDPVRQAAALENISERSVKSRFAVPVLTKWVRSDPDAAFQWLEEHLYDPRGETLAKLIRISARKDPRAAAQRLPESGNSSRREEAILEFVRGAFESDPEFAIEWAVENFDPTVESALSEAFSGSNPKFETLRAGMASRGISIAPDHKPDEFETSTVVWPPKTEAEVRNWAHSAFSGGPENTPRTWKVEDVQAATAFLVEKPELAKYPSWHKSIARNWASKNPEATLEWAASLPPELQIEAAETALGAWYRLDPKRAIAFTESLPESEFRSYAIEKVAGDWVQSDPDAAFQWATATLPAGLARDTAAGRVARHFRFRNPSRAIEVAGFIENDGLRLDSLISIVDVWSRRDQPAAEAFVRQGNLSEIERKTLLDRL